VLLNLVQKLPFPTKLPVLCPWDFIRSICLGKTLRRGETRWEKSRLCVYMTIMVPCNVAASLASDHGFLTELSCTRLLVRKIKFQTFMTFPNKYNFDACLSNLFTGY
jgi:hypothetical protein